MQRAAEGERARQIAGRLTGEGVRAVALTWVDNAGIARAKGVPLAMLEAAAIRGVGMSPVFDVFVVDDSITSSTHIGGPVGDLRLFPDLDRLVPLASLPGWAWAPADRWSQAGEPHSACQRQFAARAVADAAGRGIDFRMGFEVEWMVLRDDPERGPQPACTGPAYGMTRIVELSDYLADILVALEEEGVPVEQLHPEYAAGQVELAVGPTDPVAAADRLVLVKETIRGVSLAHGLRASFAPVVVAGGVGNGCHLHLSAWSEGANLFAGGGGPHGLTGPGESILAALLDALPALCGIGNPSVASYLRLVPQHWAGPWQCWGRENRKAALRFVTSLAGTEASAANAELKCFDASANLYLLTGAVVTVAAGAAETGQRLPLEVTVDPAGMPPSDRPARLPQSLAEALDHLVGDKVLLGALGEPLAHAFVATRQAEIELFAGSTDSEIAAATCWTY